MIDFDLIEDFARKAHEGQTRWGGEPYFDSHVMVVAGLVVGSRMLKTYNQLEEARALALVHDVDEDTDMTPDDIERCFRHAGFNKHNARSLVVCDLDLLTRREGMTYTEYITRLVKEGDPVTWAVKVADLTHNMSDLKKGQRSDKYGLAKGWLESLV